MSDKRAFEALLDKLIIEERHRAQMTGGSPGRVAKARAAALAAYAEGREGQPVAWRVHFSNGQQSELFSNEGQAEDRAAWMRGALPGLTTTTQPLFTHPAPKSDAAADWVCVPRHATTAMCAAGNTQIMNDRKQGNGFNSITVWDVMLAASPARVGEGAK